MKPRITEILAEMAKNRNERFVAVQLGLAAELMAHVSEEQAESAAQMERHTKKIIRLTWSLVWLTIALLLLTTYLCFDSYQKSYGDTHAQPRSSEKDKFEGVQKAQPGARANVTHRHASCCAGAAPLSAVAHL